MKIIQDKKRLIKLIQGEKNLGFVPTMGTIHLGHISLINKCISLCDKTVVSIYVNKPQFNKSKDFSNYPRNLKKDIKILKKLNVDYLYTPITKQIYPKGINKKIKISSFSKKLCGKFRQGHFESVVDVIDRFVKIIDPKYIFLGEKDYQQLKIVEHFLNKNHKNIKLVPCKTIREKNGIAYSSRNTLLSPKQKKVAAKIYNLIHHKKKYLIKKKIHLNIIKNKIHYFGIQKIDYIKILDVNKLTKPYLKKVKYRIFLAYYLNGVRLIDNI